MELCKKGFYKAIGHSPINIHIYDENGNHAGINKNGTFDYEIPGVYYVANKTIYMTNMSKNYKIFIESIGEGEFGLEVEWLQCYESRKPCLDTIMGNGHSHRFVKSVGYFDLPDAPLHLSEFSQTVCVRNSRPMHVHPCSIWAKRSTSDLASGCRNRFTGIPVEYFE